MNSVEGESFHTDRLTLRRFDRADAPFILSLHQDSAVVRFIAHDAMTSLPQAEHWIARAARIEGPLRGWWCLTLDSGAPVGAVLLTRLPASRGKVVPDNVQIGWRQHPAYRGQGYVTEAAQLMLNAALASGLPRVLAVTDPQNYPSQRVCERIGMRHLGRTEDYYDELQELYVAEA